MKNLDSNLPWGGLKIQSTGISLADADQIVVLLHGYGAIDTDLTPLAEYIGGEHKKGSGVDYSI